MPDGIEIDTQPPEFNEEGNNLTYIMLVSFYEPVKPQTRYFELLLMQGCEANGSKLLFRFDEVEQQTARSYKNKTVFLAAVSEDAKGNIIKWSKTLSKEL
jgi:hypothetical protein